MENSHEYNPQDYAFTTKQAMRFIKIKTPQNFNAWCQKRAIKRIRRGRDFIYLRKHLQLALSEEMQENGEY